MTTEILAEEKSQCSTALASLGASGSIKASYPVTGSKERDATLWGKGWSNASGGTIIQVPWAVFETSRIMRGALHLKWMVVMHQWANSRWRHLSLICHLNVYLLCLFLLMSGLARSLLFSNTLCFFHILRKAEQISYWCHAICTLLCFLDFYNILYTIRWPFCSWALAQRHRAALLINPVGPWASSY